jgi:hypothetical protein
MVFAVRSLRAELLQEGLGTVRPAGRVSTLRHEMWVQDGWCWAAAATMVHLAIAGRYEPQCRWAEALLQRSCCGHESDCAGGQPVKAALDLEKHCRPGPDGVRSGGLTFAEVQAEIPEAGGGRPIVCTQPGHTLVLAAWEVDPIDGPCLYWNDPSEAGEEWEIFVEGEIRGETWEATFLTQ